jgi:hypothetical protein
MNKTERNKLITGCVLRGMCQRVVAEEFGYTPMYISDIVRTTCFKLNSDAFVSLGPWPKVKDLLLARDSFLPYLPSDD